MVGILPEKDWPSLAETFKAEFASGLPNFGRAYIIADFDENNEVRAFIVVELLARIGQIWSDKTDPIAASRLIDFVEESMAPESSVIVISHNERFESLCEKLKMREVEGKVFRRDF